MKASIPRAIVLLSSILSMTSAASYAAEVHFLTKDEPDTLFAMTFSGPDCPVASEELDRLVKGVMIRSRIKPAEHWMPLEVVLAVNLKCLKLESNNPIFDLSVRFVRLSPTDDESLLVTSRFFEDYGNLGIGDRSFISQSIKDSTEIAVTEYLKVNFDLGED